MPIYAGNTTVNTSITSSNVTVTTPQSFLEYNATRNSIQPGFRLDFVNSNILDPRITFTRASSGTYTNNIGVVSTASNNTPRFDYNPTTLGCNGLLIEGPSTNLLTYSAAIGGTNWYYNNSPGPTITLNAATAPDNTTTASLYVPGTTSGFYDANQAPSPKLTDNTSYSFSVWVKLSGAFFSIIHLQIGNNAAGGVNSGYVNTWIQLTGSGSVLSTSNSGTATSASASVTAYPNGWYRCTVTGIPSVGATVTSSFVTIRPSLANGDNNMASGGDGTSGYYFWGAQLEQNTAYKIAPSTYIPTTSASASRASELAIMTGSFLSSIYNPSVSTVVYEAMQYYSNQGASPPPFEFNDGTLNNRFNSYAQYGVVHYGIYNTTGGNLNFTMGAFTAGVPWKFAGVYQLGACAACMNGGTVSTGTSTVFPGSAVNRLNIGTLGGGGGGSWFSGVIRRIAYWPVALSNAELISQTSY
jgi:hypothetical protein